MNAFEELRALGLGEVIAKAGGSIKIGTTNIPGVLSEETADAEMNESGFMLSSKLRTFVTLKTNVPIGSAVKGKKVEIGTKKYQIDAITEDAVALTLTLKA